MVTLEGDPFSDQASYPFCTGSLLAGGQYILTAAHCVTDGATLSPGLLDRPFFANFNLVSGAPQGSIGNLFVLPNWDGSVVNGNDLALLSLVNPAPTEAERYDIYRHSDELGQTFTKVGYGNLGTGLTGDVIPNGEVAFFGQNQFEGTEADLANLLFSPVRPAPLSQLLFDFDSGFSSNNLLGSLGLGNQEVNTASGDSGGPAFIGDRIAGITSYGVGGFNLFPPTDIDYEINSSFGELSGETRVSTYASFIDQVLLGNVAPTGRNTAYAAVPEPSTLLGTAIFGMGLLAGRRTRRRARLQRSGHPPTS